MAIVRSNLKFFILYLQVIRTNGSFVCREEKRKQKRLKKMGLTEEEEIAYRSLVKPNKSRSLQKNPIVNLS